MYWRTFKSLLRGIYLVYPFKGFLVKHGRVSLFYFWSGEFAIFLRHKDLEVSVVVEITKKFNNFIMSSTTYQFQLHPNQKQFLFPTSGREWSRHISFCKHKSKQLPLLVPVSCYRRSRCRALIAIRMMSIFVRSVP